MWLNGIVALQMRQFLLILCLTVASLTAAQAAGCTHAADQGAMDACAGNSLKASDGELNSLYRQIRQRLTDNADATRLLIAAQRAWVVYRDAECAFASSASTGGSAHPMIQSMCLDKLTRARIDALKGYLKCEEGDLSCPLPAAN